MHCNIFRHFFESGINLFISSSTSLSLLPLFSLFLSCSDFILLYQYPIGNRCFGPSVLQDLLPLGGIDTIIMNAIMFTTGKGEWNVEVSEFLPYLAFIIIHFFCNPFLLSYIFCMWHVWSHLSDWYFFWESINNNSTPFSIFYTPFLWDSLNLFKLFLSRLICCNFHSTLTFLLLIHLVFIHLSLSLNLYMTYL